MSSLQLWLNIYIITGLLLYIVYAFWIEPRSRLHNPWWADALYMILLYPVVFVCMLYRFYKERR